MAKQLNDLELSIIAPKFDNSDNKIKPDMVKPTAEKLSEEFGGVSIEPSVLGCWKPEDGELMCEENMEISTSLDTENSDSPSRAEAERIVERQAEKIGDELGQAAVMTSESKEEVSFQDGEYKDKLNEKKLEDVFNRVL
ncbi:MAG: hypothetical protein ABEI78_00585 [Candidatus Nanohaloarchaea archaeon]